MIERDWLDHDFIDAHTIGFEQVAAHVAEWTPARTAEVTGVAARRSRRRPRWWGTAKTSFLLHARGIEHHSQRRRRTAWRDQHRAGHRAASAAEGCGYATITGQGNGQGGREHGQKCDQLPGARDIENPEHRAYIAGVWGVDETSIPGTGRRRLRDLPEASTAARSRACLSICFNPLVSLPDSQLHPRGARQARVLRVDRLLPQRDGASRRHRAARLAAGGGRRHRHAASRGASSRSTRRSTARATRGRTGASSSDIAEALGRAHGFTFATPREIFDELRVASQGRRRRLLRHHIGEASSARWASSGRARDPRARPSRHAAPVRAGAHGTRSRRARAVLLPRRQGALQRGRLRPPAEDVDAEYPIILTTGRVVSQFLSGTQTRRIGPLVDQYPEPRIEMHPRLAERARHRRRRLGHASRRRRGDDDAARAGRDDHPAGHGVRPVPLAGREERQPAARSRAQDPISQDPRVQGLRRCRVRKAAAAAGLPPRLLEPQRSTDEAAKARRHARRRIEFFIDPSRCIGCQACVQACAECDTHRGAVDDPPGYVDRATVDADGAGGVHALRGADLREVCPADAIKRTEDGVVQTRSSRAASRCSQLRARLPVRRAQVRRPSIDQMMKCDMCYDRTSRGTQADVRDGLPEPGAVLRAPRGDRAASPDVRTVNTFQFGMQTISTRVSLMVL